MNPNPERPLRILQVNTFDDVGGAARVARNLFEAYRSRGHDSRLAVGHRALDDPAFIPIEAGHGVGALPRSIVRAIEFQLGIEDFRFPGTWKLLDAAGGTPDVLHTHNLHGGYFDLRALSALSRALPVFMTLHDAWLLSGHCGHSLDCERWRIGCGHCPDLSLEPSVRRDATAYNWRRKRRIYEASRLHVATPSRWLMSRVEESILMGGVVQRRVIPNGVDLSIFHPGDRALARAALDIPGDVPVILFSGYALRTNRWKDYDTARTAIEIVAARLPELRVLLVALGQAGPAERMGGAEIRFVAYEPDPSVVARYYQAADVCAHPTRADTFPNTVLEAMACGTPVVASAVGGIPEQVEHGRDGFLVPVGDPDELAGRLVQLIVDGSLRESMGRHAAQRASHSFGLDRQADEYVAWYREVLFDQVPNTVGAAAPRDA